MEKHRHYPKASVQLMYNASQFFTTGTEFQCYKCKATVVPTLAGRFMIEYLTTRRKAGSLCTLVISHYGTH